MDAWATWHVGWEDSKCWAGLNAWRGWYFSSQLVLWKTTGFISSSQSTTKKIGAELSLIQCPRGQFLYTRMEPHPPNRGCGSVFSWCWVGSYRRGSVFNRVREEVRFKPPLEDGLTCFEKPPSRPIFFPNLLQDEPPPKTTLASEKALQKISHSRTSLLPLELSLPRLWPSVARATEIFRTLRFFHICYCNATSSFPPHPPPLMLHPSMSVFYMLKESREQKLVLERLWLRASQRSLTCQRSLRSLKIWTV